jgi:hypothetical protein
LKSKKGVIAVMAVVCVLAMFNCLDGLAGNLEPEGPPGPTMVTLGQLSEQIQALSTPVNTVVRGVVTFDDNVMVMSDTLSRAVDPNKSVVLLSEAVTTERRTADYPEWVGRTGTVLVSLSANEITIRTEQMPVGQQVSYQIVEYK